MQQQLTGYIFQIYYNSTYGIVEIEYIGKEGEGGTGGSTLEDILKSYPKIEASYDEKHAIINAKASIENGKLTKMELIYKGQILKDETRTDKLTEPQEFDIKDYGAGWYKIKVTAEVGEGKNKKETTKIAWVKATNLSAALLQPSITIEPSNTPNGNNKWYKRGEDDTETKLTVTIDGTNSPTADRIFYTAAGVHNEEKTVMEKTATFEITETGLTTITAKVGSADGYESREASRDIKLDNIKPEITELKLEPKPGEGDVEGKGWINVAGEIKIEATDTNGSTNPEETVEIEGYEYSVKNLKTNKIEKGSSDSIETPIKISTDGEYLISVQVIDEAGNKSETKSINVYKDGTKPTVGNIQVTESTSDGFLVHVEARDDLSGLAKLECYVDGTKRGEEIITEKEKTGGTVRARGLNPLTEYTNIYVVAYDSAGNNERTFETYGTTLGSLAKPTIRVTAGAKGPGTDKDYYSGTVTITVTDPAGDDTGATHVEYKLDRRTNIHKNTKNRKNNNI